jgi:hypothetical protein
MKRIFLLFTFVLIIMFLAACNLTKQFGNSTDPITVSTMAMQTVQAISTERAFATMAANATEVSNLPTVIVIDETQTSAQKPTNTPGAPLPTSTLFFTPLPSFTPVPMDQASFVKDVTYPDNTIIASGTNFTKTWRLKNSGQTTWSADYEIVFASGNSMEGKAASKIGVLVRPGETIDLSIDLKSPASPGKYKGEWMLRNTNGKIFGLGEKADKSFWVIIQVENYQSESVPTEIYPLDFVAKICQAQWKSNYDKVRIPCDTDKSMTKAYVAVLSKPKLENGYVDDERTIHMHLDGDNGSWLQGFYPALQIKNGAIFSTVVGCLDGNKSCNVTVSLDVRVDGGSPQNIGKWVETYDEKVTKIDINLNDYAGKNVEFILGISNRSNTISDVFWLAPRVVQ